MKTLSYGLVALLLGAAVLAGCGRHAAPGAGGPASGGRPADISSG
jgi:predicted small secreted protein